MADLPPSMPANRSEDTAQARTIVAPGITSSVAYHGAHVSRHLRSQGWLNDRLWVNFTTAERRAVDLVARARPASLRAYDQIPMRSDDLLRQVKLVAPYLDQQLVVFMGDADSTSMLLGLLRECGNPCPKRMVVLDFDERLLEAMHTLAARHGFGDIVEAQLYNVFDPVPTQLRGQHSWFYINPPYGCRNEGASARLFLTRGCELVHPSDASGCIILPYDAQRPWTRQAMRTTQGFLYRHGWTIRVSLDNLHQYHLDDDRDLASSMLLVDHTANDDRTIPTMPYAGRRVDFEEIPNFYGLSVEAPYPRYIRQSGQLDYTWPAHEVIHT